jgi:hypothetical protein
LAYQWARRYPEQRGSRRARRAQQAESARTLKPISEWQADAIQRFGSGAKSSRVVEMPDSNRYVFIRDAALVVREMRTFLLAE